MSKIDFLKTMEKIIFFRGWEIVRSIEGDEDRDRLFGRDIFLVRSEDEEVDKESLYKELVSSIMGCVRCKLYKGRTNIVIGSGPLSARLMIVGEAPGRDEDIQGKPFVGKAGRLLTNMLRSININRENVYITNVVKCRPPNNRNPENDEIKACWDYLDRQIEIISPKVILALGNFAIKRLTGKSGVGVARKSFNGYKGIPVIATYHPAALLRNPSLKRQAYQDLLLLRTILFR